MCRCGALACVVHVGVLSAMQCRPSAQHSGDRQTPGPQATSCKCPPGLASVEIPRAPTLGVSPASPSFSGRLGPDVHLHPWAWCQ